MCRRLSRSTALGDRGRHVPVGHCGVCCRLSRCGGLPSSAGLRQGQGGARLHDRPDLTSELPSVKGFSARVAPLGGVVEVGKGEPAAVDEELERREARSRTSLPTGPVPRRTSGRSSMGAALLRAVDHCDSHPSLYPAAPAHGLRAFDRLPPSGGPDALTPPILASDAGSDITRSSDVKAGGGRAGSLRRRSGARAWSCGRRHRRRAPGQALWRPAGGRGCLLRGAAGGDLRGPGAERCREDDVSGVRPGAADTGRRPRRRAGPGPRTPGLGPARAHRRPAPGVLAAAAPAGRRGAAAVLVLPGRRSTVALGHAGLGARGQGEGSLREPVRRAAPAAARRPRPRQRPARWSSWTR